MEKDILIFCPTIKFKIPMTFCGPKTLEKSTECNTENSGKYTKDGRFYLDTY